MTLIEEIPSFERSTETHFGARARLVFLGMWRSQKFCVQPIRTLKESTRFHGVACLIAILLAVTAERKYNGF